MELTKEYLEQHGWKIISDFREVIKFTKGDVWKDNGGGAFLTYDTNPISSTNTAHKIIIVTTDPGFDMDGPKNSPKFNGICPSVEDYERIVELIDYSNIL